MFLVVFNTVVCLTITPVQLTLDRVVGGNSQESLNGYMVAPREDTGTLGADVAYVGSWELGTHMKLVCNGVSTLVPVFAILAVLEYSACCIRRDGCLGMFPMKMSMHSYANDILAHFSETSQMVAAKNN